MRIPSIPVHIENFILSILFQMFLPLFPLFFEYWQTGVIKTETLTLLAALFAVSIGVSSRRKILFGISIIIGIIFSVAYGLSSNTSTPLVNSEYYAGGSIIIIFLMHAAERWNLHAIDKQPYWNFIGDNNDC